MTPPNSSTNPKKKERGRAESPPRRKSKQPVSYSPPSRPGEEFRTLARGIPRPRRGQDAVRKNDQRIKDLSCFPGENPFPVLRTDLKGIILYANPSSARIFGSEEINEKQLLPGGLSSLVRRAVRSGKAAAVTLEEKGRFYHFTAIPFSENEYVNIYGMDITERKKLEDDLRHLNEKLEETVSRRTGELSAVNELLERLFSGVHFLVAYVDSGFNFRRVNRAFAEAYGQTPEYFVGKNHFRLFPDPENERIFRRVVRTGRPFVAYSRPSVYSDHPERGPTYWDWSLRPVRRPDGGVEGLLLTLVDVTERKRAEKKLQWAEKKMADMERLAELGTLSSMVAHEMRTPLATIRLAADNLRRKAADPALEKNIRSIVNKVEYGNRVIDNLLEYSRLRLPGYRRIRLLPLLRASIADSLKTHSDRKITLKFDPAPLRRKQIEADPDQLREVFTNILDNAIEAVTDKDCRIEIAGWVEKNQTVVLKFRDNGPEVTSEVLDRSFTPFVTSKPWGTGLGLSICRELVRLHNGAIDLKPALGGGGAVATVRLPLFAPK